MSAVKHDPQVRSRQRVRDRAEVFTHQREVDAMLDLIDDADGAIFGELETTFLEPACGNGAFLAEILRRKLRLARQPVDVLRALTSIYGIDIQADNVKEAHTAMLAIAAETLAQLTDAVEAGAVLEQAVRVIACNVVVGDSLAGGITGTQWVWKHGPDGWVCTSQPATLIPPAQRPTRRRRAA